MVPFETVSRDLVYHAVDEGRDFVALDMSGKDSLDESELSRLDDLLSACEDLGIEIELHHVSALLRVQMEVLRMGRRLSVVSTGDEKDGRRPAGAGGDPAAEVMDWRRDPDGVVAYLTGLEPKDAAFLLEWIVREEDRLYELNLVRPYQDLLPGMVSAANPDWLVAVLELLDPWYTARILLGDYTRLSDEVVAGVLARMEVRCLAAVLERMASGLDWSRRVAGILLELPDDVLATLSDVLDPKVVLSVRVRADLPDVSRRLSRRLAHCWSKSLCRFAGASQSRLVEDTVAGILELADGRSCPALEEAFARRSRGWDDDIETWDMLAWDRLLDGLRAMEPDRAGALLAQWISQMPRVAEDFMAEVLEARWSWPGGAQGGPLGAAVAAALADPDNCKPFSRLIHDSRREAVAGWIREIDGSAEGLDPAAVFAPAKSRRFIEKFDGGRYVHIDEVLAGPFGPKSVALDLLELDLRDVELRAHIHLDGRPGIEETKRLFAPFMEGDARPSEEIFRRTGLFRLSEELDSLAWDFAINGNFYFDYGHLVNAGILGIPLTEASGLRFGDPIGWMVVDGREVCPPAFNRGALFVTREDGLRISRVCLHAVQVAGRTLRWRRDNDSVPPPDEVVFYNSLHGLATPSSCEHISVAVAGGRIVDVRMGAAVTIPFTGYALLVPRSEKKLVSRLALGQTVVSILDGVGQVVEAMACGPLLVRSGQVDVDFELEEFGRKDSAVMSFFLPRLHESYEAARSFVAVRRQTIIFGTVSGRAMGAGTSGLKAGLTFGELAVLARDLGADNALALDGGGSSSLVMRQAGRIRLLNVPTGGSDVPPGSERFISTALVARLRK